jgi:uncharacterized membrane protein
VFEPVIAPVAFAVIVIVIAVVAVVARLRRGASRGKGAVDTKQRVDDERHRRSA